MHSGVGLRGVPLRKLFAKQTALWMRLNCRGRKNGRADDASPFLLPRFVCFSAKEKRYR